MSEGVPEEKIAVVPLAYEGGKESVVRSQKLECRAEKATGTVCQNGPMGGNGDSPHLPERPSGCCAQMGTVPVSTPFSSSPQMRVLFLGQAIVRKGIHDLVHAARLLQKEPIAFDVVGAHGNLPDDLPGNVTFHGPVPRGEAGGWYERADLFVLPTHSDGFALTQLEAMAHGLPIIATPCCGDVVEPGRTGWLVQPGSPEQLADVLREAMASPERLMEMGRRAVERVADFSIERLGERLMELEARSTEQGAGSKQQSGLPASCQGTRAVGRLPASLLP